MKLFSKLRLVLFLLAVLAFSSERAQASGPTANFALSAINTSTNFNLTNVYFANKVVTTILTVSNYSGGGYDLSLTNAFSGAVTFEGIQSNAFSALVTTNLTGNTFIFTLLNTTTNPVVQIIFNWLPQASGPITNSISASVSPSTTVVYTNLVIGQFFSTYANLGVTNYIISQAYITNNEWVITNDWVTYGVTVTNLGSGTVTGVVLTNTLPTGITLITNNQSFTTSGTNLLFTVGTLTNGESQSFQLTVTATNNGAYALTDTAGVAGAYEAGSTNDVATEYLNVTNYLSDSTLLAITNSGQTVNRTLGTIEQTIQVANTGGSAVQAVRLVVTGLTNQLYNASGTNNSQPFVVYPLPLAAHSQMTMRLEYNPRFAFPFTNGQLHAYEAPATTLYYAPPPGELSAWPLIPNSPDFYKVQLNADGAGDVLLEFTNISGSSFSIVYFTNGNFANPLIATPAIFSTANRIQWLDYGPPGTVSAPTNSGVNSRYYEVYQYK